MERKGIACAGSCIIDNIKIIDSWPDEGHLANILSEKKSTGGLVCNVLLDLAKLQKSIPLQAIGLIGKDTDGDLLLKRLSTDKIDITNINITDQKPTSYTDVMSVRNSCRRTYFHNRGANQLFSGIHFHWDKIYSKILHLGYILLLDGLDIPDKLFGTKSARVLNEIQKHGIKTSIDIVTEMSNRFTRLLPPTLPYVDYLILNELEAGHTTGHLIRNGSEMDITALSKSADKLMSMGVRELVVIHCPEGGLAVTRSMKKYFQPSLDLPMDYIQGTAGAGDAFCSGMLYGIHENWDIQKSLQLAVSTAAACISDASCSEGILPLNKTMKLFEKYPPREMGRVI